MMKIFSITILLLLISTIVFSQEMIEEIGDKTCECIQNTKEGISFDDKFQKCAVKEIASYSELHKSEILKNDKNYFTTENTQKRHLAIKSYIEENCESNIKANNISDKDLKTISNDACNCITKIDMQIKTRNDSIKSCINSQIVVFQMTNLLSKVNTDETSDKVKPKKVNINLQMGTNTEMYKQVEKHLLKNCIQLKSLLMSNNNEESSNSVSENKESIKFYNEGLTFSDKRDYVNAIPLYEKALEIDDNFAYAWDNLGMAYRHTKQYDKAIKAYKKSIKLDPKGVVPIMNLGVVYSLIKNYDEAILTYKKYIELADDSPEGYYGLGRMQLFTKDYDASMKNIVTALNMYTENNSPYRADAINMIKYIYQNMNAENRKEEFFELAKKYNLELE